MSGQLHQRDINLLELGYPSKPVQSEELSDYFFWFYTTNYAAALLLL